MPIPMFSPEDFNTAVVVSLLDSFRLDFLFSFHAFPALYYFLLHVAVFYGSNDRREFRF